MPAAENASSYKKFLSRMKHNTQNVQFKGSSTK